MSVAVMLTIMPSVVVMPVRMRRTMSVRTGNRFIVVVFVISWIVVVIPAAMHRNFFVIIVIMPATPVVSVFVPLA